MIKKEINSIERKAKMESKALFNGYKVFTQENIILDQLGGSKFIAMTGARDLLAGPDSFHFKIGRNKGGYKGVKIDLDNMDLYRVTFWKLNRKYELVSNVFYGIYADQLQSLFTKHTGLDTHL